MDTATNNSEGTDDGERRLLAEILARFGPRTHLQPMEIAELIGLKTCRPINRVIASGALPATVLPGCDRLRFVEIDDFLVFMRDNKLDDGSASTNNGGRKNGSGGNGHRSPNRKRAYVVRDGRAVRARRGARSV